MSFNPSSPQSLGLEWLPTSVGQHPLTADADVAAFLIDSKATETIDALRLAALWPATFNNADVRKLQADVYSLGNLGANEATTFDTYLPNAVTHPTATYDPATQPWRGNINGVYYPTPISSWVTCLADDTNYTFLVREGGAGYSNRSIGDYLSVSFGSTGYSATKRPVALYVDLWGAVITYGSNDAHITLGIARSTSPYHTSILLSGVGLPRIPYGGGGTPGVTRLGPFYVIPETILPWSGSDVREFDATWTLSLAVTIPNTTGAAYTRVVIYGIKLVVESTTERRVAWGAVEYPRSVDGVTVPSDAVQTNVPLYLQHSDVSGDDWSKLNGTDYLVVLRHLAYPGYRTPTGVLRYLNSASPNPHGQGQGVDVTIDGKGRLLTVGAQNTRSYAQWLERTDNATSVDSQPYFGLEWIPIYATAGFTAEQTITPSDNRTYSTVRGLIGYTPGAPPDEDLSVQIIRESDDVVMGSGSLSLTEFAVLPNQMSLTTETYPQIRAAEVKIVLSSAATLVSGTAYRIEFSTSSTGGYWLVATARTEIPDGMTGDVSVAGSGTALAGTADLVSTLIDRPAAPGTITAVVTDQPATDPGDILCEIGSIPYVTVDWAATVLGTAFDHYEVERYDDVLMGWQLIANVRSESTSVYVDRELARNVDVWYRVRVVRSDGGISAWATAGPVTGVQTAGTVHFVSNNAGLGVGFQTVGENTEWTFRSSAQVVLRPWFGRDYELAMRPTEILGVQFPLSVLIWNGHVGSPSPGEGRQAFTSLLALTDNPLLPYIAVLTADGERFYANVVASRGTRSGVPNLYVATLKITEIAGRAIAMEA